jgi:hypothetical protein
MEKLSPVSTLATSEQDYNSSKHSAGPLSELRTSTDSQQVILSNHPSQIYHRAQERARHLNLIYGLLAGNTGCSVAEARVQDIAGAPLSSIRARYALEDGEIGAYDSPAPNILSKYGFLGIREATYGLTGIEDRLPEEGVRDPDSIYTNLNVPRFAFIRGRKAVIRVTRCRAY